MVLDSTVETQGMARRIADSRTDTRSSVGTAMGVGSRITKPRTSGYTVKFKQKAHKLEQRR